MDRLIDIAYKNLSCQGRKNNSRDISLFWGHAGDMLLIADLYAFTGEMRFMKLLRISYERVVSCLHEIRNPSFAGGLAGVGYALVVTAPFMNVSFHGLDAFDALIMQAAYESFRQGDYDLQTGLIGYGMYFLSRLFEGGKKKYAVKICEMIKALFKERGGISFLPYFLEVHPQFPAGTLWTNNGFLHGVNSVIAFFLLCAKHGILSNNILRLLHRLVEMEASFYDGSKDSFPMAYGYCHAEVMLDWTKSELFYCTGDYGIITNLLKAGSLFKGTYCNDIVTKSYSRMCERMAAEVPHISSMCFCHGLATVAYFCEKLSTRTFSLDVNCYKETLLRYIQHDGVHDYSVLNGDNGIIMALLSTYVRTKLENVLLL